MKNFILKGKLFYPFLILLKQNSASKTPENFYCACANKHKKNWTLKGKFSSFFNCIYPKTPQLKVITLKILANKIIHFFCCSAKQNYFLLGKLILKGGKIFQERNLVFAKNSNFLIPISLKLDGVNIISNLGCFTVHRTHSLKYQDLISFEPMF